MKSVILKSVSSLALVLALNSATALAVPISGTIGFTGPYVANNSNLTAATQITFSNSGLTQIVTDGSASGSFAGIASGTPVTMFTPLIVNQPGVVLPNGPIWSVGGFSLTLSSLGEVFNNANILALQGAGSITSTSLGLDTTPGTWVATFNNATSGAVTNFTFSASSAANPAGVPEGGSTAVLLGLALVSLGSVSRRLTKN